MLHSRLAKGFDTSRRMLATSATCRRCGWIPQPRSRSLAACDSAARGVRILTGDEQPTLSDGFLIIDKPPGLVVQSKYPDDDSAERQLRALLSLDDDTAFHFPHRLDKHAQVHSRAVLHAVVASLAHAMRTGIARRGA